MIPAGPRSIRESVGGNAAMTQPGNILLIAADQLRYDCLEYCTGHPTIKTPESVYVGGAPVDDFTRTCWAGSRVRPLAGKMSLYF